MVHPRQCICDQCMAEYGTFKFYNQILQASAVVDQNDIANPRSNPLPKWDRIPSTLAINFQLPLPGVEVT